MNNQLFTIIIVATAAIFLWALALIVYRRDTNSDILVPEKEPSFSRLELKIREKVPAAKWTTYKLCTIIAPIFFGIVAAYFTASPIFAGLAALAAVVAVQWFFVFAPKKANDAYSAKYAKAIQILAASMSAGNTYKVALQDVAKSELVDKDIRSGFHSLLADLDVGTPPKEAFQRYGASAPNEDAADVAAVLALINEVGGDGGALNAIATSIQARVMANKEIKSMFAGTSVLIIAMDLAPIVALLLMYYGMPSFMAFFTGSTLGLVILFALLLFSGIGSYVLHTLEKSAKGGRR